MALNAEILNVLIKKNSKIKSIDDIKNTIIDVGSKDSATYTFLQKILKHCALKEKKNHHYEEV